MLRMMMTRPRMTGRERDERKVLLQHHWRLLLFLLWRKHQKPHPLQPPLSLRTVPIADGGMSPASDEHPHHVGQTALVLAASRRYDSPPNGVGESSILGYVILIRMNVAFRSTSDLETGLRLLLSRQAEAFSHVESKKMEVVLLLHPTSELGHSSVHLIRTGKRVKKKRIL